MGIEAVKLKANEIANILMENGHQDVCQNLLSEIEKFNEPNSVVNALEEIIGYCHVKAIGDLHIKSMDHQTWSKHIEKLQLKTNRALKQLKKYNKANSADAKKRVAD
jgi:hypothetical protein